jgi:hypothetical protein
MISKNPTKALPVELMPGMNKLKPNHDREMLKQRHCKSPDVSKYPFSYHDPRQKYIKYFTSLERKNRFLERLAQQPNHEPLKKGGRENRSPL